MNSLSRRRFLKITGAAAGIAATGSALVRAAGNGRGTPTTKGLRTVPTACDICFWKCGAIASVRDGVLWKIEGNPLDPLSRGRFCPRGTGGDGAHFDPDRLRAPLMRKTTRREGPIGGIHAGLRRLNVPAVLTSGCQTPFLSASLFRYLLDASHSSPALAARAADGVHPLCGIYRREALPLIEQFLAAGRFKLFGLLDALKADVIDVTPVLPFYHSELFTNVNDPQAHLRVGCGPEAGIRE